MSKLSIFGSKIIHELTFSGPDVQLGCKAINFMQIDLGETATRTIDIVNNSDIDAVYQVTHAGVKKI